MEADSELEDIYFDGFLENIHSFKKFIKPTAKDLELDY
jgi:hypothetical protein